MRYVAEITAGQMLAVVLAVVCMAGAQAAEPWGDSPPAPGGLVVQVLPDDVSTAVALAETDRWLTLVLARDEAHRARLRADLQAAGAAGMVTVGLIADRLPLADRMANAVLLEADAAVSPAELERVLVPERGRVYRRDGSTWAVDDHVVAMPEHLAPWTHFLQGASGTKVNPDPHFEMPDGLRFIAGPRLQDANGANGWRVDDGVAMSEWNNTMNTKSSRSLYVEGRDAFNGVLLWQDFDPTRETKKMHDLIMADGLILRRKRVAGDNPHAPNLVIAAADAVTGQEVRVYASCIPATQVRKASVPLIFTYHAGQIIQLHGTTIRAFGADDDQIHWTVEHEQGARLARPSIAPDLGLVMVLEVPEETRRLHGGGRYPAEQAQAIAAYHLESGELAWRLPIDTNLLDLRNVDPDVNWEHKKYSPYADYFHQISYRDGRFFFLNANDANGGKPGVLWAVDARAGQSDWIALVDQHGSYDMFPLADGTVFVYGSGWQRFDQSSGSLIARGGNGVNARCDTGAASENLILAGFGNVFDVSGDDLRRARHDIARGQCGGWGTPAYGMIYHHGSGCGCYFPVRGNMAIHAAPETAPVADDTRLLAGPAIDRPLANPVGDDQWPAYLYNGQRRGWNPSEGPRQPREAWRVQIAEPLTVDNALGIRKDWLNTGIYNGPVTAPVIADGLVVVSDREGRRICGYDAESGAERWTFATDGRVFTPPTLARGRVVFGGRDGFVYALDAATGELAWRFQAAPEQRYLVAYGQLESVWPVHGCLPVVDDVVVATAGYHGDADGGVWAWGLDLANGSIRWQRVLSRELQWQGLTAERKDGSMGFPSYDPHEFADFRYSANIRIQNVDLPRYDDRVVEVARARLVAGDGSTTDAPPRDRLTFGGERYSFLDMQFERRSGPHGEGSNGIVLHDVHFNVRRKPNQRPIHNGSDLLIASKRYPEGLVISYLAESDVRAMTGLSDREIKAQELAQPAPIFTAEANRLLPAADSFVAGGGVAYMATEGGVPDFRDRPIARTRKGSTVAGELHVIAVPEGQGLTRIEVDSAVINNGLAVADGRLYSVHEDGTLRCWE